MAERCRMNRRILAEHIRAASGRPFSWGADDCSTFVADALVAMGKADPMADIRGRYTTAKELKDIMPSGLLSAMTMRAERLGWWEIAPHTARNGDVCVLTDAGGQRTAAICFGWLWHAKSREGVTTFPLSAALRAWRPC